MKRIVLAARALLVVPLLAILWYFVIQHDRYFPGRYEDAVSGTAIAVLVALPGAVFLTVRFLYFGFRRSKRDSA